MSQYKPVPCPNGGRHDLPLRVLQGKDVVVTSLETPLFSIMCRRCKVPVLLTGRDLGCSLAAPQ